MAQPSNSVCFYVRDSALGPFACPASILPLSYPPSPVVWKGSAGDHNTSSYSQSTKEGDFGGTDIPGLEDDKIASCSPVYLLAGRELWVTISPSPHSYGEAEEAHTVGSLQGETVSSSSGNQKYYRQLHSSFYPQLLHINPPEHKMHIFFSKVRKCQKLTEICLLKMVSVTPVRGSSVYLSTQPGNPKAHHL